MPTYNSVIARTEVAALIPEDAARDIISAVPQSSVVMQLARRLPNMTRATYRMPVVSALPTAYFVTGDNGLKQTSEVNWDNVYVTAEELAVIVPIPQSVLDDVDYDIWSEVKPLLAEAFGKAFDEAVLFGTNAPASWPDDLLTAANAAGNKVVLGSVGSDLYDDIMSDGGVLSKLEADGYMATGHIAAPTMFGKLRGIRATDGQPIFVTSMQGGGRYELDGRQIVFPTNGSVDAASALLFSGDWTKLVYAIRQDITYKVLTEAVIQDGAGAIVYNLAQQDMVALRAVMRLGWQVPNPINRVQGTAASRYPVAVLTPS